MIAARLAEFAIIAVALCVLGIVLGRAILKAVIDMRVRWRDEELAQREFDEKFHKNERKL